jgi:CMP-2-keto-3-deoxyoctulosonic acid synthetase
MGHKVKMVMLDSNSYAVDYPEDIKIVEKLL